MKPTENADPESVEDSKRFRKPAAWAAPPKPAEILKWALSVFPKGDSYKEHFLAKCIRQTGTTVAELQGLVAELSQGLDNDAPKSRSMVVANRLLAKLEPVANCAEKWVTENPRLVSRQTKPSRH